MKTKEEEIIKKISVFTIILFFIFYPVSPLKIFSLGNNNADARELITVSGFEKWTEDRVIDGGVSIGRGATLVIEKGVKITFKKNSTLYVDGKLFVKGTRKNPVKFKMDGVDEISFGDDEEIKYTGYRILVSGEAIFKNVDISGGGDIFPRYLKNNILSRAYASDYASYGGAIVVQGGRTEISGCYFHDNVGGIQIERLDENNDFSAHKNIFEDNYSFDADNEDTGNSDFRYNWWRNSEGPEVLDFEHKIYKYIWGNVDFSNWLISGGGNEKEPVIIVPGILGSEEKNGKLQLDPIFHTYDNLYDEFIDNGYVAEKDLFTLPYDWRNSNVDNSKLLKDKIDEVKEKVDWPKVDIVAHSMGGLLAREYIESDYYNNDIDQLITLGTPNRGAPEAYLKWEAGAFTFSPSDIYLKHRFSQEAEEKGYKDIFHYIQKKIPSVQELLPDYGYLYDANNDDELKKYPDNYPINDFLENLNSEEEKLDMLRVEYDKIIGNIKDDNESTATGLKIVKAGMGDYWLDGYPIGFEIPIVGDRGIIYGYGDETVPIESAESKNIYADHLIEIDSTHRDLPTDAQKDVLEILTGNRPDSEVRKSHIKDILMALVHSPIDIQLIAPDGKRVGKDFETGKIINEIKGAYYTGSDTENEFLTIPNPIYGEYKILTQGTGDGDYKIDLVKILEKDTGEAEETTKEITGIAEKGNLEEKAIKLDENNLSEEIESDIGAVVAGAEISSDNSSSDDNDGDSEDKKGSQKDTKDDKVTSRFNLENGNIIESIDNAVPGLNEKVFSSESINPDRGKLYEYKEENKKFTGIVIILFLISSIFSLMFLIFRRMN